MELRECFSTMPLVLVSHILYPLAHGRESYIMNLEFQVRRLPRSWPH